MSGWQIGADRHCQRLLSVGKVGGRNRGPSRPDCRRCALQNAGFRKMGEVA